MTDEQKRAAAIGAAIGIPAVLGLAAALWPRKAQARAWPAPDGHPAGLDANLKHLQAAAQRYNVPLPLLVAVAHYETGGRFDPMAAHPTDSRAVWERYKRNNPHLARGRYFNEHRDREDPNAWGSKGLMQLILATALIEGLPFEAHYRELFNPGTSAALGAARLRRLLDRYSGNLRDVLAAYNSGRPFATAPTVTRDRYVPGVTALVDRYRARYS